MAESVLLFGDPDLFNVFEEDSSSTSEKQSRLDESQIDAAFGQIAAMIKEKRDGCDLSKDESEEKVIELLPRVELHTVKTLEGFTHEVAVPLKPLPREPAKTYPFTLDHFQEAAIMCVENQQSVLVSAHSSARMTVVAIYTIALSLRNKQHVIFATPTKASSNQKYNKLCVEFTTVDIGLMTGDVTINPKASCIVMTTGILRSMLYYQPEFMRNITWVIYDEINHMGDKELGVLCEETIILMPDSVQFVFLSSTISNGRQFAEWICHLHKQQCHVYTDYRPTPLHHYILPAGGDGMYLVVDENKIEAFNQRLYSHCLHKDRRCTELYEKYEQKTKISHDIKDLKLELQKKQCLLQMNELRRCKLVLRRLDYCKASDVIKVKGGVACKISSGDELLLTELLFKGVFNDLTPQQACALISCFVFQEKASEMPKLDEELSGPLKIMQDTARRIARISKKVNLDLEEETYVDSFRPHLMDVVNAWCNGASFCQICKMTDVFEGSIIRAIRRLEETLKQMEQAAKAIGNAELENKFTEGIRQIKRDIVFAESLYW